MGNNLHGANVVLTGATSPGIGSALLAGCVDRGAAKIFLLCRDVRKGEAAVQHAAKRKSCAKIEVLKADFSSMADVETAARHIVSANVPIHVILSNAATIATSGGGRPGRTAEGLEESFAVNVAAPILLAELLVPALAPEARIVVTGSSAGQVLKWKLNLETLEGEGGMGVVGFTQYARTKLALHQSFAALGERLGARAHLCVFHPGAVRSSLGNNVSPVLAALIKPLLGLCFRSAARGAVFGLHAASAAEPVRGYLSDGQLGTPSDFRVKQIGGAADAAANERTLLEVERRVCKALGCDAMPPLAAAADPWYGWPADAPPLLALRRGGEEGSGTDGASCVSLRIGLDTEVSWHSIEWRDPVAVSRGATVWELFEDARKLLIPEAQTARAWPGQLEGWAKMHLDCGRLVHLRILPGPLAPRAPAEKDALLSVFEPSAEKEECKARLDQVGAAAARRLVDGDLIVIKVTHD